MESDQRLRTEYSFPERLKRTVQIFDASENEVEMSTLVTEIQEVIKKSIPELNLSAFPDELVFCVNAARHLMGNGDDQIFNDGLAMFFGMMLAAFMEENKLRIETEIEPINPDDLIVIEGRLSERVMKRAGKASLEVHAYQQSLFIEFEALAKAVQGELNEDTCTSKESIGSRSSDGDDEERTKNICELLMGSDNSDT